MKQHIDILGREVEFELTQKNVKNMNLRVKPGGEVFVSVPPNTPSFVIEEFIQAHGLRILKAIDRLASVSLEEQKRKQKENLFLPQNGDAIPVFGSACRLRICKSDTEQVVRDGAVINVYLPFHKDLERVQLLLDKWRDALCRSTVTAICKSVYPSFQTLGVPYPKEIRFRKMSASWGNCRPETGVLTFSKNLIEVPLPCIEFVVQHEFAHFLHANHSDTFYQTLDTIAPHWREAERLLRNYERGKHHKSRGQEHGYE